MLDMVENIHSLRQFYVLVGDQDIHSHKVRRQILLFIMYW